MGQNRSRAFTSFTTKLASRFRKAVRTLKRLIDDAIDAMSTFCVSSWDWIKHHPVEAAIIITIIIVAIILIALMPHILAAVSFTAAGPMASSAAAAWQASIGSVAAGSLFAVLQSAAMGGYGIAIVAGATTAVAVVSAGIVRAWNWFRGGKDGDDADDEKGAKDRKD